MIALAQIGLRIYCIDAHIAHDPAYPLAVDDKPVIPAYDPCDCPVSPCRMGGMYFIDPAHKEQFLIGYGPLLGRLAVDAAPVDVKKLGLPADIDPGITEINAVFSSSQVRGFGQIFF